VGRLGLSYSLGLVGAVIGAGVSSYLSAAAAKTVVTTEAELDRKRAFARQLDYTVKNVEINLELFQTEKTGLVSSVGAL
jgi:hypothetical protein